MSIADSLVSFFALDEHDTDVETEIVAGVTTFLTMSYIVVVNPSILSNAITIEGYSQPEVVRMLAIVTLISAAVATLMMAFYANRPFAQAPGLGLNAFFAFTVVIAMEVPWQTALAAVVVEGVVFMLLTAVGARKYVIELFPEPVKFSVGVGIGLFLAIIGLENMHVMAATPSTFVTFNPAFASDPVAILSVLGLLVTFVLYVRGVRGAIMLGIVLTSVAGYVAKALGVTTVSAERLPEGTQLMDVALAPSLGAVQYSAAAYDISPVAGAFVEGLRTVEPFSFALIVFTFFFVDFFDTAGTLTGVSQTAGFLNEEGDLPEVEKPLMSDAVGTTVGGILGTSTVTTYVESATGVEEGGRTGMTALVTGLLFLATLAVVPLAAAVPMYASHIALVMVGIILLSNVTDVDWDDITQTIPAGMTILVMPLTYSIAYGIAAGIISYPIVKAAAGEWDEINAGQWLLAGAFVVYFYVRTSGVLTSTL